MISWWPWEPTPPFQEGHPGPLRNRRSREEAFSGLAVLQSRMGSAGDFARIGHFTQEEVEELSDGRLKEKVSIVINRKIFDYDLILILGPVFPHEVVGYSGGAKYLFPGISGGEFLHFFHWLGAVMTCEKIIGIQDTPVRRMIDRAMEKITVPIHCLAMVVDRTPVCAGSMRATSGRHGPGLRSCLQRSMWSPGMNLTVWCWEGHPAMYDEIWTAGKVMYKLEQVVAEDGTLIIYAPHIREVSRTWGAYIERIGYHTRDYFLAQMERFKDVPEGRPGPFDPCSRHRHL